MSEKIDSPRQVKVMLKVAGSSEDSPSFKVDRRHKQVTLTDPTPSTSTPTPEAQDRRVSVAAPKMFAFDAIFTEEDNQVKTSKPYLDFWGKLTILDM